MLRHLPFLEELRNAECFAEVAALQTHPPRSSAISSTKDYSARMQQSERLTRLIDDETIFPPFHLCLPSTMDSLLNGFLPSVGSRDRKMRKIAGIVCLSSAWRVNNRMDAEHGVQHVENDNDTVYPLFWWQYLKDFDFGCIHNDSQRQKAV